MRRMNWQKLISETRVRELMGGAPSTASDHRSQFQRDFDRVVFSSPVRRLQDKTQVFPLDPSDAVRTRLTHSLEVSAVARGIAELVTESDDSPSEMRQYCREIQTIAATVGLVHDLGNPPFGHYGEASISTWFTTKMGRLALRPIKDYAQLAADFLNYEGNARTLRLLCSLQVLTDRYGLNLTAGTISAAMKYTAPGHAVKGQPGAPAGQAGAKPGYLFAEKDVVEKVREATGTWDARNPIAYLVEAADDCVYSLCDLEDAVKKGVVSWHELSIAILDAASKKAPSHATAVEAMLKKVETLVKEPLRSGGISLTGASRDYACAQWFRVKAAAAIVEGSANAFTQNYSAIMQGEYRGELVKDPLAGLAGALVAACKQVGRDRVYNTRQTIELEMRGRTVLHGLLDQLWPGVEKLDESRHRVNGNVDGCKWRAYSLLSENYRSVFDASLPEIGDLTERHGFPEDALRQYYRLLLLTDYVGGMTDTFACTLHKSLCNG